MNQNLPHAQEIAFVENIIKEYGYQFDATQEKPFFYRHIAQNDLRSPYAFSVVLITFGNYTVTIEGLNEPRLKRAVRAGLIEINGMEDIDALKELVYEADYDQLEKLKVVFPFFENQLAIIANEPIHTDNYKRALSNIQLLVEAAEQIE